MGVVLYNATSDKLHEETLRWPTLIKRFALLDIVSSFIAAILNTVDQEFFEPYAHNLECVRAEMSEASGGKETRSGHKDGKPAPRSERKNKNKMRSERQEGERSERKDEERAQRREASAQRGCWASAEWAPRA
jgi:hypothetical protein